jgi:DsbC/DsbD-like thiol-disulfide interchange protein
MKPRKWMGVRVAAALTLGIAVLSAQGQADNPSRSVLKGAVVEYLFPEQITVTAEKSTPVALHFRIAPGLHINSHTPKDEFLIPTTFSIPEDAGVKLESAHYPTGTEITLTEDPGTKLSVFSGEFVIQVRIVAKTGNHLVEAKLRYQACDNNACMPPKTIPVAFDVIGK